MTAIRRGVSNSAFVLEHNRRRIVVLFGVIALAIVLFGARDIVDGAIGFVGLNPALILHLSFALLFLIIPFGALFWFISRPRKYTVSPDSPQIVLGFENCRGQPD